MRKTLTALFAILLLCPVFGQSVVKDPLYWKNRKPYEGYWQQDVLYKIKAKIDDKTDQIVCKDYQLIYTNNSPDTLNELFFHLFSNAFQPNSYYHKLWQGNGKEPRFGSTYEEQGKGTEVSNLQVNDKAVTTELDNTILKVNLNSPLLPNSSIVISMEFTTYYDKGEMRRRMKMFDAFGNKHYDGVHWYPSIAVYDRKFGWTTDQHLDKEFYHDFGTFEVELTFPQHYIVEATGELQNTEEVLPKELRQKLDISNFKDKPYNSAPSEIIPVDSNAFKTWKFVSHNTHNFVFTADPSYRFGEVEWNGVKCIALAQEPHASKWQQSAGFLAEVIKTYSTDFGMYCWPKIIIADAQDGMEYSMITLDGGTFPGHKGLIAHEVGHMWFYGQVGSNETYRANMDEGFTQFLTAWFMDKHMKPFLKEKYTDFGAPFNRFFSLYNSYLNAVWSGYDHPLNTHSAAYNGGIRHGGGYGLVYYKQGTMLYNLQYVLGEELFANAMKNYFEQWKFAHPYPADFRKSIIDYTGVDLNWFFDQWLETTKYIDYGISSVKPCKKGSCEPTEECNYTITFRRKGRMQMPLDFIVVDENGDTSAYHIPNTWFVKKTDATVLPKWYGWDLLQEEYTAKISVEGKIANVIIDPSHLMADKDLRNNQWKGFGEIKYDNRKPVFQQWNKQFHSVGPAISYDKFGGIQAGVRYSKNYFGKDNFVNGNLLFNTGLMQNIGTLTVNKDYIPVSLSCNIHRNFNDRWRELSYFENFKFDNGLMYFKLGMSKVFRKQDQHNPNYSKISIYSKHMINSNSLSHENYYLRSNEWDGGVKTANQKGWRPDRVNASLNIAFERNYVYKAGNGNMNVELRTPGVLSDYNYSFLQMTSINTIRLGKLDLKSRVFGRLGTNGAPKESSLYLASANQEEMLETKYIEIAEFLPNGSSNSLFSYGSSTNIFQQGGGLNLRGYAGYLAPEVVTGGTTLLAYTGNSGLSWNMELDFDQILKFKKRSKLFHLDTYVFSDMGMLTFQNGTGGTAFGKLTMDAGIGSALTVKFPKRTIQPITLRFDLPLLLNRVPFVDYNVNQSLLQNSFSLRYVIGIGRSF